MRQANNIFPGDGSQGRSTWMTVRSYRTVSGMIGLASALAGHAAWEHNDHFVILTEVKRSYKSRGGFWGEKLFSCFVASRIAWKWSLFHSRAGGGSKKDMDSGSSPEWPEAYFCMSDYAVIFRNTSSHLHSASSDMPRRSAAAISGWPNPVRSAFEEDVLQPLQTFVTNVFFSPSPPGFFHLSVCIPQWDRGIAPFPLPITSLYIHQECRSWLSLPFYLPPLCFAARLRHPAPICCTLPQDDRYNI